MSYKELIDVEFKKINDEHSKKIDKIEKDLELLEKGYKANKFNELEYSKGKFLLRKEIEKENRIMKANKNSIIKKVCENIEEKLTEKYNMQHDELEAILEENKVKINNVENEIEKYFQDHKNDIKELAEKQEKEKNNSISKMKEFQTSKLKMECVYIPEEKKQQFIEYIQMGVIPVKLLDSLELLTAKESVEKKILEDIEVKYNNEKIELEKQLEEKNKNKMDEKQLLEKEKEEIEQKIKELEEKHEKEISEISGMKQKYEDGPELV